MTAAVSAPDVIVVTIPIRITNPLNSSQGVTRGAMFAKAKARKEQRSIAWMMVASKTRKPIGNLTFPVVIHLTRISPRPFDGDGLAAAFKGCRDGVADALGVADNSPLIEWVYAQRRGKPKEYAVQIKIERKAGA